MFTVRDRESLIASELSNARGVTFAFLENGSVFSMMHGGIMINQVLGSPIDGALGNIYLRRHLQTGIAHFPLRGPASASEFRRAEGSVSWTGARDGLEYHCTMQPAPNDTAWFWMLDVRNASPRAQLLDVVFTQDLGLGSPGAVRTNELYTSQYIDHTVFEDPAYGYVICSRQNQAQEGAFPWILHGCFPGAVGYLTDGFQFYGLEYRQTNVPVALTRSELPNRRYQYELALPTLKSALMEVPPGGAAQVTFFAVYREDHPEATDESDLEKIGPALKALEDVKRQPHYAGTSLPRAACVFDTAPVFAAEPLTAADLDRYFSPHRRYVESDGDTLLSFFYGSGNHVVCAAKDLLAERPHGTILRSGVDLLPGDDILSLTVWMYGVFNSHLAIGNTNFNKLLSVSRNPLNVLKSSGQRIFLKTPDGYALLGLPSAFEMGLNSARWIYKGRDITVVVTTSTSPDDPASFLQIDVEGAEGAAFLISHNVVVGDAELDASARIDVDEARKRVEMGPAPDTLLAQYYPDARFFLVSPDPDSIDRIGGDELLFHDGQRRGNAYVALTTRPVTRFSLALTGNVASAERARTLADKYAQDPYDRDRMQEAIDVFWRGLSKGARLTASPPASDVGKLNDVVHWYVHNAMVQFTTPYGLEQYSGAAWGTRDVCQGPIEFLLATRNFDPMKSVLRMVYSHQLYHTGDWPQWFMFDRYREVRAPDSHADVIIWPLKAVCDYVEATDDGSILDEPVPYSDDRTGAPTEPATLFAHTLKQIDRMEESCIPGTALAPFGHGDWEDTLQPADPGVRDRLVSTWTVELMYQTLRRYALICGRAGRDPIAERLYDFCGRIRSDFNRYLVKDGVAAGLVYFEPNGVEYLLHPDDHRTGVQYRLLPMTRGMISGMFTLEQMWEHLALIREHLLFPDGARLMNRPMAYHGGTERLFKRAESAANFGREIGLLYTHAHIRYVEAMARIGHAEEAMRGLLLAAPIAIQEVLPSALPRQSNAYFSSSDAGFTDRYEASRHFDRVKSGEVGIKGGWRIYSSGPGIFIAQLISNILGLRDHFSDVLLDPVLPRELNGLAFDFEYAGRKVRYRYHVTAEGFSPHRVVVNDAVIEGGRYAENPYRRGGMLIPRVTFVEALNRDDNVVDIHI